MGFFNWAAPLFGHFADRWSDDSVGEIVSWVRPYLPAGAGPSRILDVGGGTGALATRLHAATGAEVTVLDPTPEMLRYIPENGPVRRKLGTAEAMPFDDGTFDLVVVTDAFHHFRDQPAAAREFARVVRCGGGVLVVELDPSSLAMKVIARAERLLGEPGAFFTPGGLCTFMADNGIAGACTRMRGVSYRFLGTVTEGSTQVFQR